MAFTVVEVQTTASLGSFAPESEVHTVVVTSDAGSAEGSEGDFLPEESCWCLSGSTFPRPSMTVDVAELCSLGVARRVELCMDQL